MQNHTIDCSWLIANESLGGRPKWKKSFWVYNNRKYRSLRLLRTKSNYKLETLLVKTLAKEIRKEIDSEILQSIRNLASQPNTPRTVCS